MSLRTLPKTLFARKEKDGDETYFIAGPSLEDAVESEGVTMVGVYRLESVQSYRWVTERVKEG